MVHGIAGTGDGQQIDVHRMGNHSAEGVKLIPISLVVGIAEKGFYCARARDERYVDHSLRIASIERSIKECLVGGEGGRVGPNSQCQRQHGHNGEPDIAPHHARSVAQILQHRLRKGHQVDLAHPLPPNARIADTQTRFAACLGR